MHLRDGTDRCRIAVEIIREALDRDDPIRVEQEDRQHRTLALAAEADLLLPVTSPRAGPGCEMRAPGRGRYRVGEDVASG